MRFEFIEIFLRIAKGKFLETNQVNTLADAMTLLLNQHILPLKPQLVDPWLKFRE